MGIGDNEYGASELISLDVSPPGCFCGIAGVVGHLGPGSNVFLGACSLGGQGVVRLLIAATSCPAPFCHSAFGLMSFLVAVGPMSSSLDGSTIAGTLCKARWGPVYVVPGILALSRRGGERYLSLMASRLSNFLSYFSMDSKLSNLLSHR